MTLQVAMHHLGATFYSSISKTVLGPQLRMQLFTGAKQVTLIDRFFSANTDLNLAVVACAAMCFCKDGALLWVLLCPRMSDQELAGSTQQEESYSCQLILLWASISLVLLTVQTKQAATLGYLPICRWEHYLVSNIRKSVFTSAFTPKNSCSACKKRSGK